MRKTIITALTAIALGFGLSIPAQAAGNAPTPPAQKWTFQGIFGTYDRGALKRGFQVYNEVCASCHSIRFISYRNLMDIGFTEDEAKAIAAEAEVEDGPNDEGDMFARPGKLSDKFVAPFANDKAARASNNGALPPDLSLIVKARKNGYNYLYGLMTGYHEEAPKGVTLNEGMSYNEYFPGHQIAMAPPLDNEAVEYADGTKPTLEQHASDVVTFLAWAASPEMEERKRMGIKVLLFLIVLTAMLYALKRKIWADLH